MNIRIRVAVALLATLAIGLGACSKKKASTAESFPDSLVGREVVAVVANDTITSKDLRVLAYTTTAAMQDSMHSRSFNLMLLDQMIDRVLFIQEARAAGTQLPDSIVNRVMAQFIQRFGGAGRVEETLKPLGFTRDDVRTSIQRDLMIRAYVEQKIEPTITINEADVRAFFEQNKERLGGLDSVRVQHIIVMFHDEDTPEKRVERRGYIAGIRQRALKGQDFGLLAKQYSEDGAASGGGDLGYFVRGTMVPEFENAAFALKEGAISDIVETRFGYHIIRCVDHTAAKPVQYEAVKSEIEASLKQQALGTDLQNRLKRNRDAAIIVRNYETGA